MILGTNLILYKPSDCNHKALIITDKNKNQSLLISYDTKVMEYDSKKDEFILGHYINYKGVSRTTKKHIVRFLKYISIIYNSKYENKNLDYILNHCKYIYNDDLD